MATLSGTKIKDKFGNLLHVEGGITSTTKNVEDGTGNASALKLSDDTVEIDGDLNFTAAPTTDSSEATALLIDSSTNVVKRELGTAAFKDEFPRIIARATGNQTVAENTEQDVKFNGIDNATSTASFIQDDGGNYSLTGTGNTTVVCGSAGIYRIGVSLYLTSIGNSAVATVSLLKNGSPLLSPQRSKGSVSKSVTSYFWTESLSANDQIKITLNMATAAATIAAGSCLEVHRIA